MNKNTEKKRNFRTQMKIQRKGRKEGRGKRQRNRWREVGEKYEKRMKNNFDKESTLNNIQREG